MKPRTIVFTALFLAVITSATAAPGQQGAAQKLYFDNYSLVYPTSYAPQPLGPGDAGTFLIRTAPFGFMVFIAAKKGEDTVVPQGRAVLNLMLGRLSWANEIASQNVTDIPPSELTPPMTFGRHFVATTTKGMQLDAHMYLGIVSGRKMLMGYATISAQNVRPDMGHLLTTNPGEVASDFADVAASVRYVAPGTPR